MAKDIPNPDDFFGPAGGFGAPKLGLGSSDPEARAYVPPPAPAEPARAEPAATGLSATVPTGVQAERDSERARMLRAELVDADARAAAGDARAAGDAAAPRREIARDAGRPTYEVTDGTARRPTGQEPTSPRETASPAKAAPNPDDFFGAVQPPPPPKPPEPGLGDRMRRSFDTPSGATAPPAGRASLAQDPSVRPPAAPPAAGSLGPDTSRPQPLNAQLAGNARAASAPTAGQPQPATPPATAAPAAKPEAQPYRDRTEAVNDAVDLIESGVDPRKVYDSFMRSPMVITRDEIDARGVMLGGAYFTAGGPTGVAGTVRPGAMDSQVRKVTRGEMPGGGQRWLEPGLDTLTRAKEQVGLSTDVLAGEAGLMSKDALASRIAKRSKAIDAAAPTLENTEGQQAISEAGKKGIVDTLVAMRDNPVSTLTMLVDSSLQSLPISAGAGMLGFAAGGPAGAVAGAYGGSFAQEYSAALLEAVREHGGNPNNPAEVLGALNNTKVMAAARDKGVKRGLVVGAFDAASAGLAGRFVGPVIKAIESGALTGKAATRAALKGTGKELGMQAGMGAGGEFAGQKAVGDPTNWADILMEAMAEVPGSIPEAAGNVMGQRRTDAKAPDAKPAPAPEDALRPSEQRSGILKRLDDFAALHGLPSSIVASIKKAADGVPLGDLVGRMKGAITALGERGIFKGPTDEQALGMLDEPAAKTDEPEKSGSPTEEGPGTQATAKAYGNDRAASDAAIAPLASNAPAGAEVVTPEGYRGTAKDWTRSRHDATRGGWIPSVLVSFDGNNGSAIGDLWVDLETVRPAQPKDAAAPVQAGSGSAAPAPVAAAPADEDDGTGLAGPAQIAGDPINRNWTAFAPESGTLNIPREQMPQVDAEHRGAFVNFLNARGVAHQQEEVAADTLKPTQAEFSPQKVKRATDFTGGDRSILVSSDGYIVDGTHQWLAKREAGEPVKVIRLDAPIQDLLRLAHQFPSSTTSSGAKRAGASNERVGDVAGDAGEVAAPGDGGSSVAGGSVGTVGSAADAPGPVGQPAAAPAGSGQPAVPVAAGGGSDPALTQADAGPGSDAGNGFKHGPVKGERYRVGASSGAGGALSLEKRLPAGTPATFYVGKDGGLVDADGVNFIGSGVESLWVPESKERADEALAILDEMGRLALADPARKAAKERLKALVTGSAAPAQPRRVIGRYGHTPKAATEVELRANPDGTLTPHAEGHAMLDFESGDPIVLPAGTSDAAAAAAIDEAGATTKRDRWYGVKQDDAKAKAASDLDAAMGELGGILGATPTATPATPIAAQPATPIAGPPATTPQTPAKRRGGHPATVMGSRILALISANGGISPRWLSDLSHRYETARKDKNGRPVIQWRNPPVMGVGPLFRAGGREDRQELARVLEENGYLMPGSIEADGYEAGNRAMEIISDALNRIEALTHDQAMTEAEASQRAEREAYYAELDAENQAEADAEREAIMAVANMSPSELRSFDDDDIPDIYAAPSQQAGLPDFGFPDEDINDELQAAADRPAEAGPAEGLSAAPRAAPSADGTGSQAPGPGATEEGARPALTLEAQSEQDLREKADREAAAAQAEQDRQAELARRDAAAKRARDKSEKDARAAQVLAEREAEKKREVDAAAETFELGQEPPKPVDRKVSTEQASGQGDIFGSPSPADSAGETPEPAPADDADALRQQLRKVEDQILRAVPGKIAAGGGDIETAARHRDVPAELKQQRKDLKERLRALRDSQSPAPRQLTDAEAYADNFARFEGRELAQQVLVEDTGQIATLKMDAAAALREQSARLDALRSLRACLGARA